MYSLRSSLSLTIAARTSVLGASLFGLLGCIPDPKGDYEEYKTRTATFVAPDSGMGVPVTDAAGLDSKPPVEATSGLYVGICVTSLAARDPSQALRFYTQSSYTPGDDGKGTLTLNVTPMLGWDKNKGSAGDFVIPASVSKSETRGEGVVAMNVSVATDGRFTANLGTVKLSSEANSISGRNAVIETTTLDGRFGTGDRFCAALGGQLIVPYQFTFDPMLNTCLFVKSNEGDPLPKLTSAEFSCPL